MIALMIFLFGIPTVWAMRSKRPQSFTDLSKTDQLAELNQVLTDVWSITNGRYTLENIDTNPDGTRSGIAGDLVYASFGGGDHLCINTSLRTDDTPTDWTCIDISVLDTCPGGFDGQVQFNDNGNCGGDADLIWEKNLNNLNVNGSVGVGFLTAPAATVEIDPADSTGVTAEDIAFRSSAQTVTLADGTTLTTQRQNQFIAPTVNGVSGGGTETVTNAATVYVDGPPSGSNITFTNGPWGQWLDCTVDGDCLNLLISNSQANAVGSTDETAQLRFGFGSDKDTARIIGGKLRDYSGSSTSDALLQFNVDVDNTSKEVMRIWGGSLTGSDLQNGVSIGTTSAENATLELRPLGGNSTSLVLLVTAGSTNADRLLTVDLSDVVTVGHADRLSSATLNVTSDLRSTITAQGRTSDSPAAFTLADESGPSVSFELQNPSSASTAFYATIGGTAVSSLTDESPLLIFNQDALTTRALASGATLGNLRFIQATAPIINGVAGGGTETVTNAATFYISAAPSGSNITFTNGPYALWVDAGAVKIDETATVSGLVVENEISGTSTTSFGWTVQTTANTACTTTCTSACVFGQDTGTANGPIVSCTDATADRCLCAGAN